MTTMESPQCRSLESESGKQKAESRRRKAEGGRRKAEGGRRKAEGGRQRSPRASELAETGNSRKLRNEPKSGVQKPEGKNRASSLGDGGFTGTKNSRNEPKKLFRISKGMS